MKATKECLYIGVLVLSLLGISYSSYASSHRVLVEFKSIPTKTQIDQILKLKGIKSIEHFDTVRLGKLEHDYFRRLFYLKADKSALKSLLVHPKVAGIEKIGKLSAFSVVPNRSPITNDEFLSYQWGINNFGQIILQDEDNIRYKEIKSVKGRDIQISDIYSTLNDLFQAKEVIVAVIDSGIDLLHPDLKDSLYRNKKECDASGNIIRPARVDNDENGFKGDCIGWNFTTKRGNNNPKDYRGHGTHVAGIIAASTSNALGVASLAPAKVKILPLKIFNHGVKLSGIVKDKKLVSFTDVVAKAIRYAVKMNAKVINMSFGWPRRVDAKHVREAVKLAIDNNVAIITGAGNNDTLRPVYPCAYQGVVCVGAISIDGTMAGFSNYGGFVDLTAPGEDILSTYPQDIRLDDSRLKFTQNGYNYISGTSQAAPFVSLAFATLKGIYPHKSNDSLLARLYETALPRSTTKFTKAGLIQLEDAINMKKIVSLKPIFKNLHTVHVNLASKKFSFKLPIKNYWQVATNVKVKINIKNDMIVLDKNRFNINRLSEGESNTLHLTGIIKSSNTKSDNILEVEISTSNSGVLKKTYIHNISFARNAITDEELLIKPISYHGPTSDLIEITESDKIITKLETINDKFRDSKFPEYFFSKVIKNREQTNLELSVFTLQGNTFKATKTTIADVTNILTITRVDLNYDGKKDYFIRSLNNKNTRGHNPYILYSFLDSNLKPLFNKPHFKFFPNTVIIDNTNINYKMSFIAYNTIYGKIAIPFFLALGTIPINSLDKSPWVCGEDRGRQSERNPDVWACEEEDNSRQRHAYYLIPDFDKGILKTKLFDNYKFREALESRFYNLSKPRLLGLTSQDKSRFNNGQAIFQMALGPYEYFSVIVSDDLNYQITPLDVGFMQLEGVNSVPITHIKNNYVSYYETTGFTTLQNSTLAEFLFLDPQNPHQLSSYFSYEHTRKKDHILAPVANFIKDDTNYSVVQTKSTNVVRIAKDDSIINTYDYPVHRVTFLPGSQFMEFFYPFVIKHKNRPIPALYIDATDLNTGHVYFVGLTDDGPIASINNNIYIPDNCTSMNQTSIDSKEAVCLLCRESRQNKLVFKYLPITIND
ncbi:MAG: S8 family serine peptidase [Bacteriovoracaceae bacterium]|nr:S8 family serine peptidase [Bacteriovoracaceae bacterium]